METKRFTQKLSVLLVTCVMTVSARAQDFSGNGNTRKGEEVVLIATKDDWESLCDRVNGGETGLYAKMTADVDLGENICQLGETYNMYSGTFDGQGHTLSFRWNDINSCAPFFSVNGATIQNLRTQGKITAEGQDLAGLIYQVHGATTISNCITDVDITSSYDHACNAAGMIAWVSDDAQVTITDCLVKGSMSGMTNEAKSGMAGFVYEQKNSVVMNNCLYVGTNNATGGYTLAPHAMIKNCYYLTPCGETQGTQVTAEKLASGEMAYLLQGTRTDLVWGQAIGTDLQPTLTDDATKRVYQVGFTYHNQVMAKRYANQGGRVTLPTAQEVLGTAYDASKTYTLTFSGGFSSTTAITGDTKIAVTVTESTTGIDDVMSDAINANGAVFNLQGQRVSERADDAALGRLPAGVYIVNGRKVVVR